MKSVKYRCPECLNSVAVTPVNRYRKHPPSPAEPCRMTHEPVPVRIMNAGPDNGSDEPVKGRDYDECPLCSRMPKLDADGAFKEHSEAKGSDVVCGFSGRLPTGKRPGTIPGATEYAKELESAAEASAPCPEPGCNRTPTIQDDGTLNVHMKKDWGQKVCPMSGKPIDAHSAIPGASPSDGAALAEPLFPTEVFLNGEATPLQPRRVETLALPPATATPDSGTKPDAQLSPPAEFQALAQAFPRNARTLPTTQPASAPPAPAAAPEIAPPTEWNPPPEITHAVPYGSNPPIPVERLEFESCSCSRPETGQHVIGCVLTLREKHRTCGSCGDLLRGYHECDGKPKGYRDMFVPAGGESEEGWRDDFKRDSLPFVAAGEIPAPLKPLPMDEMSAQLVARMKEIFYAYSNRTDRSVQKALGPSEVGTPCDRRLAMSIMGIPKSNPGGDNWASFVGTCVHTGLAEMFEWADAGQGRFAVEQRVEYPNILVPKGTADLLDRTLLMVDDHKLMGRWSLDKLRLEGIKPLYLTQLMLYAYGLKLKGEKVKYVALIAWPREQATLNDLTAVVLPYDATIADQAFARVDRIAAEIEQRARTTDLNSLRIARSFEVQDDCTYCPFFAKGDSEMVRGCNGKR